MTDSQLDRLLQQMEKDSQDRRNDAVDIEEAVVAMVRATEGLTKALLLLGKFFAIKEQST